MKFPELITPNLAALISERGGQHTGAVLGMQSAASSFGQVGGPLFGGALFAWQANAPFERNLLPPAFCLLQYNILTLHLSRDLKITLKKAIHTEMKLG